MSNWSVQSLPENYIFPPDKRPGNHVFPVLKTIPVVDLDQPDEQIIQQIIKASRNFGFYQVINHNIQPRLMDDTMNIFKEFFGMPAEYKARFYSTDSAKKCRIYSSTMDYDNEQVHYWRDNFTHHCHPLHDQISLWPDKPTRYREVVGTYSLEVRKLMLKILEIYCKGLGIKSGFFDNGLSEIQLLSVNHHIPCPDPSLTLGMPEHCDPNLITVLQQCSVPGLQVFHNGEWMDIEPMLNTFLVFPGLQLKVISNGKFRAAVHRVVTHAKEGRTTIGTFLIPSHDRVIEPAAVDEDMNCVPAYRGFTYKEFFRAFVESCCDADTALGCFHRDVMDANAL